jgi:dolichol-phosphate mannosyltransferase
LRHGAPADPAGAQYLDKALNLKLFTVLDKLGSSAGRAAPGTREAMMAQGSGRPALSVVVPCYNEAEVLPELYRRLTAACRPLFGQDYELVLVDDGSRDATRQGIRALADADPRVVGVLLSRNHGHQLALTAGLSICRGERILIIDADLQDPPELLAQMLPILESGADVVYGTRLRRDGETFMKRSTASLFYRLLDRMVDIEIPRDTGDFRLMSRRALDILNAMPEQHRFVRGMVSWIGLRQVAFPYDRQARVAGETKYPFSKMLRFAVDAITGFSIQPLRLALLMGMVFGASGLLVLAYTLYAWAAGHTVAGWTSLMVIVLILGSAQLFVLGVMGEYLGRLYMEAKRRPLFIIEQVYAGAAPAARPARAEAVPAAAS